MHGVPMLTKQTTYIQLFGFQIVIYLTKNVYFHSIPIKV